MVSLINGHERYIHDVEGLLYMSVDRRPRRQIPIHWHVWQTHIEFFLKDYALHRTSFLTSFFQVD